jgi:hypothetical protein
LELLRIEIIGTKNKPKQTRDEFNGQKELSEGLHLIHFEQLKSDTHVLKAKKEGKSQDWS